MENKIRNIAASVHQRLLNQAKKSSRPFNELLQYYAVERFLYRLSKSDVADRFILKGAVDDMGVAGTGFTSHQGY